MRSRSFCCDKKQADLYDKVDESVTQIETASSPTQPTRFGLNSPVDEGVVSEMTGSRTNIYMYGWRQNILREAGVGS